MGATTQVVTKALRKIGLLFAVVALVVLSVIMLGCNAPSGEENLEKDLPEITGITVINSSYEHDGQAHGIE